MAITASIRIRVKTPQVRIRHVRTPKTRIRALPRLIPIDGEDGTAATIAVGTVTTGAAGSSATVTNVGTSSAAVFDFVIPQGDDGAPGVVQTIVGGTNVTIDSSDPANPIVNSAGGDAADVTFTPAGDIAATDVQAAIEELDSEKAALSHTHTASQITDFSTAADARVSAAIGVTVQAYDADLTAWAAVNPSSYSTTAQIAAAYQPLDSDLTSWAGVTRAAGFDTFATTPSSANLRALLSDETGTGIAYFVGGALGTPSSATLTNATGLPVSGITASTSTALGVGSIELGHASDTTLARSSAGNVSVEGNLLYRAGGTDVAVADGGTNISSYTTGDVLYASGATTLSKLAIGTSGYALKSTGSALAWAPSREVLTADRTYYVRADGSDSNTGLVDSSGGAFLTIQKAIDVSAGLDLSIYNVTISVASGTWTVPVTVTAPWIGSGTVTLQGNGGTLNVTGICVNVTGTGSRLTVAGYTLVASTVGLQATDGGSIYLGSSMVFGACSTAHIRTNGPGSAVIAQSISYSVTGAAARHLMASPSGYINVFAATCTLSGTLNFSSAFAFADRQGFINAGSASFTGGTITGQRYNANYYGLIYTAGGGASFFPGNSAGTDNSGSGKYV